MSDESENSRATVAVLKATSWVIANPARERRLKILAALAVFQGTALLLVANKFAAVHPGASWGGMAMIVGGGFVLLAREIDRYLRPVAGGEGAESVGTSGASTSTMAEKLLGRLTLRGRLDKFLPVVGIGVMAADVAYNRFLSPSPELLSIDFITLGLGAALVAYPFIPRRFTRERNFVLIFFAGLTLFLAVPLLALRIGRGPYTSVDEYTAALLAPQLGWIVNAIGPVAFVNGNQITFITQAGEYLAVHIATSCSGLYSMGIFIAAFVALVLSEYSHASKRVGLLLLAGIGFAYLANLLRMTIIVEVGYYYGGPALLWTHANLGDIIFLLWVAPFLWLTYRLLDPKASDSEPLDAKGFEEALRSQGIDPASVTEDDWFCASCFQRIPVDANGQSPTNCSACGAEL